MLFVRVGNDVVWFGPYTHLALVLILAPTIGPRRQLVYDGLCFESSAGLYYVAITQWFIAVFAMVMFTFRSVFYPSSEMTTVKGESNPDEENNPHESNVTAIEDDTHIVADLARFAGTGDDEQRFIQPLVTLSSLSSGLMNSAVHASVSSFTDGTTPALAPEWNDVPSESSP
jgi:hypothetical protein